MPITIIMYTTDPMEELKFTIDKMDNGYTILTISHSVI